jgi:D-glucosaminate-specific PTS system IIB component
MTKWVNQVQANKIVIVSDELANDDFMKSIYLLSAPTGITVDCLTAVDAVKSYQDGVFGEGRILLLLPSLEVLESIFNVGVKINSVQVGGLGGGPSRKVVFQNITLDDADAKICEDLSAQGVSIVFQTIPEDSPQDVESILKKYRG